MSGVGLREAAEAGGEGRWKGAREGGRRRRGGVAGPRGEDGQGSACREKAFVCFVGEFAGGEGGVGAARVAVWRIVAAGKEELGPGGERSARGDRNGKGGKPKPWSSGASVPSARRFEFFQGKNRRFGWVRSRGRLGSESGRARFFHNL
jgi:hypothetical protein